MKTKLISLAMGALLVGCTAASATGNYTITAEIPTDDFEGLTAYLVNFDTGEKIDSTMIDNGKAVFKGSIATPALARIIVDGNRMGSLVVENAEISTQTAGHRCIRFPAQRPQHLDSETHPGLRAAVPRTSQRQHRRSRRAGNSQRLRRLHRLGFQS